MRIKSFGFWKVCVAHFKGHGNACHFWARFDRDTFGKMSFTPEFMMVCGHLVCTCLSGQWNDFSVKGQARQWLPMKFEYFMWIYQPFKWSYFSALVCLKLTFAIELKWNFTQFAIHSLGPPSKTHSTSVCRMYSVRPLSVYVLRFYYQIVHFVLMSCHRNFDDVFWTSFKFKITVSARPAFL